MLHKNGDCIKNFPMKVLEELPMLVAVLTLRAWRVLTLFGHSDFLRHWRLKSVTMRPKRGTKVTVSLQFQNVSYLAVVTIFFPVAFGYTLKF